MTYRVIIEPPAEAELEEAYQWIARAAPQAAARWYNGLVEAIDSLESLPERCPLAPENDAFDEDIRQLLYGKR
jgi:plasmid stabilization system protein ParE